MDFEYSNVYKPFATKQNAFDWLEKYINKRFNDYCIDNFRIAECGNVLELKKYKEAYESGCCGYIDFKVMIWKGIWFKSYLIGCNYGH